MDERILKVLKVAVTGGAGSGKTTVCNRLKELGVKVISSDVLAKEAVAHGSLAHEKIVNYFGEKILLSDGNLSRQALRRIIINDDVARLALERFIHPEISRLMHLRIAQAEQDGDPVLLVEVPLLFELGMAEQFDVIIVVSADHELRVKRLMERDNVSRDEAEDLINVQMPQAEKVERAEFVLANNCSKDLLISSVDLLFNNFFQKYLKMNRKPLTG
ncbi:MAG: dephospho-CoA kinase [Desulfobacterales bacterium]|jgi:dephospho-CoA kinase